MKIITNVLDRQCDLANMTLEPRVNITHLTILMDSMWMYMTFLEGVIVENIIPRNVIINRDAPEVDNHISRDNIFDFHPLRERYVYFIVPNRALDPLFSTVFFSLMPTMVRELQRENNAQPFTYMIK